MAWARNRSCLETVPELNVIIFNWHLTWSLYYGRYIFSPQKKCRLYFLVTFLGCVWLEHSQLCRILRHKQKCLNLESLQQLVIHKWLYKVLPELKMLQPSSFVFDSDTNRWEKMVQCLSKRIDYALKNAIFFAFSKVSGGASPVI